MNVSIQATPQRVIGGPIVVHAQGRITVKSTAQGATLIIPPLAGIKNGDRVAVTIFDMEGRTIARKIVAARPGIATPVGLSVGKGARIVKIVARGIPAGNAKIITL
jgi:hypothetical protein